MFCRPERVYYAQWLADLWGRRVLLYSIQKTHFSYFLKCFKRHAKVKVDRDRQTQIQNIQIAQRYQTGHHWAYRPREGLLEHANILFLAFTAIATATAASTTACDRNEAVQQHTDHLSGRLFETPQSGNNREVSKETQTKLKCFHVDFISLLY